MVVLFGGVKSGMVVVSDGKYPVGFYSATWMTADFKELEVTEFVTLWEV
jgi:hypothetical protein